MRSAESRFEMPAFSSMSLDDLKREVERWTAERDRLETEVTGLTFQATAERVVLAALDSRLQAAQVAAEESTRERYKLQRHGAPLLDSLLGVEDLESFFQGLRYIETLLDVSVSDVVSLREAVHEHEAIAVRLAAEKTDSTAELAFASAALDEATRARDEAQRKADLVNNAHLVPDGANWSGTEDEFVTTWAPRIDAYLAGSPLGGQGASFARAAWANHIDPRWSAAISTIESGKGAICIRPHNAWGWGAADSDPYGLALQWSSWEEAINAHARSLASGYGYTVSPGGAEKYCPSNWEEWYATVVSEMNRI